MRPLPRASHPLRPRAAVPLLLALPLLLAGCSGNQFPYPSTTLKGAVTLDGVPLEMGSITFTPQGAGQAVGATIKDGAYTARGVPLGAVVVTFQATRATGKMNTAYSQPFAEVVNVIPRKYQTGINLEVDAGQREQSFDLRSR